jgi:hypothetical protein
MMWMKVLKLAVFVLFCAEGVWAADGAPPTGPRSETKPSQPTPPNMMPAPPPSTIDPGIQKLPETVPDPKAAIPPPNVDPEMVIDPEKPREPDDAPAKDRPATPPPSR